MPEITEPQVTHAETAYQLPPNAAPKVELVDAPNGDGKVALYRDGYKLQHLTGRRAHRRIHVFDDLWSFARWLNRHAVEREQTEILLNSTRVQAALDPRDTIGDWVVCDLVRHPRFAAWEHALRRKLSQKELVALLRARRGDFREPQVAAQLLGAAQSVRLIGKGERRFDVDELGFTRFAGTSEARQVSGAFPPAFWISVPVFEGIFPPEPTPLGEDADPAGSSASGQPRPDEITYALEVMLWVHDEGDPLFELQAPSLDLLLRLARRDAAAYLQSLLQPPLMVGLGELELQNVPAAGLQPSGPTR